MKYFMSELWKEMQITDNQVVLSEWDENSRLYEAYFNKISKHLPKKFIKIYNQEKRFHDYVIDAICVESSKSVQVTITLSKGEQCYFIKLKNVETYNINVVSKDYCICGKNSWGYAEFEWLGKGKFRMSILCDVINELEFVFNKISVTSKKEKLK